MADLPAQRDERHLYGIVDMGSNGIRFSITTLQPPTARILPTLYQHRAAISLYDAQYSNLGERQPIDDSTITKVIQVLRAFKRTCSDFRVPVENISILATEATRTAINSEHFRNQIRETIGWEVTMLPKDEEGRVGAMGIASSLPTATGLVMDLGGGSTQLSWLIKRDDTSEIMMPASGSVSMPYGAAALSRRLGEAKSEQDKQVLTNELRDSLKQAYTTLQVPSELEREARDKGGFSLYLSGGGFRGWGYILMSRHRVQPYPIPVINGFAARQFEATGMVLEAAAASLDDNEEDGIFRVSERRATQVPAVALLISALEGALPPIRDIRFCQGGVREGFLYRTLSADVRAQSPLLVATSPYGSADSAKQIVRLLRTSLPDLSQHKNVTQVFDNAMLESFANLMYYHSSHSKDIQAASALRSTTTGILASTHGVLHESRAVLGLLLCARWGAVVSPTDEQFKAAFESLVEDQHVLWWINYIGAVSSLIAASYPAGSIEPERIRMRADWDKDPKGRLQVNLDVILLAEIEAREVAEYTDQIEKVGKPKRWIGGKGGVGYKTSVNIRLDGV